MPRHDRAQRRILVMAAIGAGLSLTLTSAKASDRKPSEMRQAENAVKMIIGLNHMRCAEVTYVTQLQGSVYGVTCIARAGGKERVHYAVDATNNAVVRIRQ